MILRIESYLPLILPSANWINGLNRRCSVNAAKKMIPEGGWHRPSGVRIAPPADSERSFFSRFITTQVRRVAHIEPSNVFMLMQRNSRTFWPWLAFASRLMPWGKLDVHDRERIILRVAWNCRSRYEWGQHVAIAANIGLSPDEFPHIAAGPQHPAWDARQRTLLTACDELHHDRHVSDVTWQQLAQSYSQPLLIEILLLIGHYEMLAGVLNSCGTPLEEKFEGEF